MLLSLSNTKHLSTLVHEGKMLIIATVKNDSTYDLWYTVKQDGFEDNALKPNSTGWEKFQKIPLPRETPDDSVVKFEAEMLVDKDRNALLRSKYDTASLTADAPVQLVSHDGYVYIFRQSTSHTLLVDRFVLDGLTNALNRKLEVRFKRSKQRYTPSKPAKITGNGQLAAADSLDFRDIVGKPFYEPSTEILPSLFTGLKNGNFAVVVTPTEEKNIHRWHLFADLNNGKVTLISLRSGEEQVFDINDYSFRTVDDDTDRATYNSIPGIIKREFNLQKSATTPLVITYGLAATKYDVQRLKNTAGGELLTRDASKILLAVPTDQGIAALNFSIALDGTLAEISSPTTTTTLRKQEREILLPLTTLDQIKALGASKAPPSGLITKLERSKQDAGADCVQIKTSDGLAKLAVGNTVTLKDTNSYDGLYTVEGTGDGTFQIKTDFTNGEMGNWEKVEEETGLEYDGMLTGYSMNPDGILTVHAVNHGLKKGDQVQIVGSPDYNGDYPVVAKDDDHFTIQRLWVKGEAVNITAESRKRRGLVFDGQRDWVSVPFPEPIKCTGGFTLETWVKPRNANGQTLLHLAITSSIEDNTAAKKLTDSLAGKSKNDITKLLLASATENIGAMLHLKDNRLCFDYLRSYQSLPASVELSDEQALQYLADYPHVSKYLIAANMPRNAASAKWHFSNYGYREEVVIKANSQLASNIVIEQSEWTHLAAVYDPNGGFADIRNGGIQLSTMNPDYSQGFSFEAWIKMDSLVENARIFDFGSGGDANNIFLTTIYVANKKQFAFCVYPNSGDRSSVMSSDQQLDAGKWIHIAVVVTTNGKGYIYKNGLEIGNTPSGMILPPTMSRSANFIGKSSRGNSDYFPGKMRDVRLWNRARSQAEIKAGMFNNLTGSEDRLIGNWMMETSKNHTTPDRTGKYLGTLIGNLSIEEKACIKLFTNGELSAIDWITPMKLNANALVMAAKLSTTTAEGVISNPFLLLQGEMSEVRLWNCALSAEEIADTMHLQLTGREADLTGYWKMGGIAKEDGEMLVYDFSVNANHGKARGAPYAGGFILNGKLRDGITDAVKYCNDELFAVVEGAMYEERFEFKMSNVAADPNNIDQRNGKVFVPDLWGRISRSSEEKIPMALIRQEFGPRVGDWRTFTCSFMIPEGVRLMRCFGIADVKGGLSNIEIRRHSVRIVSDTVRLSAVTEDVVLSEIALAPANARTSLAEFRVKEMQEATSVAQLKWLDAELQKLKEQRALLAANNQTVINDRKAAQTLVVAAAKTAFDAADLDYRTKFNDWKNYWERIQVRHSGLYLDGGSTDPINRLVQRSEMISDNQLWRRIITDSGFFQMECKATQKSVGCYGAWKNVTDPVVLADYDGGYHLQWEVLHQKSYDGAAYYILHPRHSDKVMDVMNGNMGDGATVVQGNHYADRSNQQFHFMKSNVMTDDGKVLIEAAKKLRDEKETIYLNESAKTITLALTSPDVETKITAYTTEQTAINTRLTTLRAGISSAQNTYLATPIQNTSTALTMPDVPDRHSKDANYPSELKVQASLLTGSNPSTRLQAMESCAGVVALSYQDEQGCLRHTLYDTTYDTDGKGEEWCPESLSVALKRVDRDLTIPASVFADISEKFTIEFWAKGTRESWKRIAQDGGSFTLDEAATVRYGSDSTWLEKTLEMGTYSSFVSLFGGDPLPGTVKYCEKCIDAVVMRAMAGNDAILTIQLPNKNEQIIWSAGTGNPRNTIQTAFPSNADRENWTHWAFVKDCDKGEMKIYANGQLCGSNKVDIQDPRTKLNQSLGGVTSVVLDGSWGGAIAELRIWNEALGEREIEMNSLLALRGNEPGLVAYYRMDESRGNEACDKTGKHAALTGVDSQWIPCTLPLNQPGAMSFNGTSDYLQLPPMNPDYSQGLTIEAWVYYDELRPWSRVFELSEANQKNKILLTTRPESGCIAFYVFDGNDEFSLKSPDGTLIARQWIHLAATIDKDGLATLCKNGVSMIRGPVRKVPTVQRTSNFIAKSNLVTDPLFKGQMRDVRLWKCARTSDEIMATMNAFLSGQEANLVDKWLSPSVPRISPVSCCEYSRMRVNADGQKVAMMMRSVAMPSHEGIILLDEQRIEELEMKWVGNAPIKPTLVGYIEGAPPVPTENLTIEDDYNGATSVELIQSSDVAYSWTREQDVSMGATAEVFVGISSETSVGLAIAKRAEEIESGFKGNLDFAYHWQNASTVEASHSLTSSDRLELRGNKENDPNFPHLGCRFIPKNVGYALVVSGLADVYISRLKRSGRMIGYQVLPTEGIPLDINTITFLINPAYTMAGSLDGLTGTAATSKRFFGHVPAMRNQHGSLYPASYLRLTEAYHLKNQIDKKDKSHQAYFDNFNAGLVDEDSLDKQVSNTAYDGNKTNMESSTNFAAQDSSEAEALDETINALDTEIKELEGKESRTADENSRLKVAKLDKDAAEKKRANLKQSEQNKRTQDNKERQDKIAERHTDISAKVQASTSFARWQRKMEDLRIRAGKRNIVNTYVWDGDGGFHAEEEQFASVVEHSIGGSFDFAAALGYKGSFNVFAVSVGLSAQATVALTQTMSKTETRGNAMELHVDLGGVESRGITDYKDRPILPGEKVDRYRFMTFYLEKNTNHWHDFFTQVVDPEWLASNDEEARALRQTQLAAPNEVWRVLHRVTYVERPALMGFGRDMRALATRPDEDGTITTLKELKAASKALEIKIDGIMAALASLTKK